MTMILQAIIFNMDGVLIDSEELHTGEAYRVLPCRNRPDKF